MKTKNLTKWRQKLNEEEGTMEMKHRNEDKGKKR
jgi:hypothetical protein